MSADKYLNVYSPQMEAIYLICKSSLLILHVVLGGNSCRYFIIQKELKYYFVVEATLHC